MRKVMVLFLAVVALSLGCAITDYPVIFDTRGADYNAVMQSFYDTAYIVPSGQVATIWSDGTDELFTEVAQTWEGDQWLYTYNNFDPTGSIIFLDQTYCDPTGKTNCPVATAWNPDYPNAYPWGDQYNLQDNVFDYIGNRTCSGWRSLSLLVSVGSRIGECGSGIFSDKQAAAYEFSTLDQVTFRGKSYYHLPIDSSIATFAITGQDGASTVMPIYGRFNGYLDERLRLAFPITANAKYQLRWIGNWVTAHGNAMDVNMTYGTLNSNFKINVTSVQSALDRI